MQAARTLILRDVKELKVPEDVQLDEVADTAGLCWRVRITLRDDDNTTVESDLLLRFSRRHPHEPPRIFVPWRNSTPRPKFELEWAKSAQFHELQEVFVRAFAQDSWVPITSVGNVIDELLRTVREVPVTSQSGENQLPSPSLHPDAPPTERLAASTPAMGAHANFNNDAAHTNQVHMRALEPHNRANGRGAPTESSMMPRSYGRRNRRDRRSDRMEPSLLTEGILSYVLVYLPVRDIGRLATTSQAFADICDSEVLWARLYFLQPPISDTLSAWGGGLGPSRVWVGPGKWEWDGARAAYKRAVELARALPAASLLTASYDSLEEDTAQVLNAIVKLRILCSPPSDVPSLLDFDMRNAGTVMSGVTDAVLTRRIREGAEYLRVTSQSLRTDPNPHNATRLENLVQMANRLETRRVSAVSQVAARLANEVSLVKSLTIPEMNELSAQLALSQLQQDDVDRQREIDSEQNVDQAVVAVAKARIAYRRTRDISQEQRNLQRAMRMNGMRSHNRRRMFNLQASHGNRAQIPEAPLLAPRFHPQTAAFPPRADRENNNNFAEPRTNDVGEGNNIAAALFPGFAARTHLGGAAAPARETAGPGAQPAERRTPPFAQPWITTETVMQEPPVENAGTVPGPITRRNADRPPTTGATAEGDASRNTFVVDPQEAPAPFEQNVETSVSNDRQHETPNVGPQGTGARFARRRRMSSSSSSSSLRRPNLERLLVGQDDATPPARVAPGAAARTQALLHRSAADDDSRQRVAQGVPDRRPAPRPLEQNGPPRRQLDVRTNLLDPFDFPTLDLIGAQDAALGQGAEAQGDPPLQWMLAPPRHGLAGDARAPLLHEHADPRNEETEQDHPPSLLAVRDLLARNMSRIYRVGDTHVAFVLSMALKKLTLQARLLKRYLSGSTTPVEELVLGSLVRMKIGASFMSNLSHGSRVDIKDSRGDWYAGRLARRSRDHPTGEFPASASSQWVVCFDGYSAKWDEVVPNHMSALERLAPLRTHTLTDQAPAGLTTTSRPEVLTRSVLLRKTKRQRRAIVEGLQNAAFVLSPTARGSGAQAGGIAPTSLNNSQLSAAVHRSRRRPDIAYADNQAFTIKLCALGRPLIYFCTDRSQPLSEIVEEYLRVTASFNATSARSSVARGALVVRLNNRESFDTNLALRYFQAGIFGDPEDLDTPGFSEDARSRGQAQLQRYMDVEHNLLTHVEQVFALYEHVLLSNSAHHLEAPMAMADDHLGLLHEADDRVLHSLAQAARPSSATDASSRTSAAGTTAEGEDASPSLSFADAAREIETLFGDDVQILDTTRSAFELGLDSDTLLDVVPFF